MPAIAVLAAAAAWCFLQVHSRRLEALAGRAGPHGNFLDNDQWLSTVSQYDRDKYWNRFRDGLSSEEPFELAVEILTNPSLLHNEEQKQMLRARFQVQSLLTAPLLPYNV